jgi:hypothetical protein
VGQILNGNVVHLLNYYNMKAYGGVDVQFYIFLALELAMERNLSCYFRLIFILI